MSAVRARPVQAHAFLLLFANLSVLCSCGVTSTTEYRERGVPGTAVTSSTDFGQGRASPYDLAYDAATKAEDRDGHLSVILTPSKTCRTLEATQTVREKVEIQRRAPGSLLFPILVGSVGLGASAAYWPKASWHCSNEVERCRPADLAIGGIGALFLAYGIVTWIRNPSTHVLETSPPYTATRQVGESYTCNAPVEGVRVRLNVGLPTPDSTLTEGITTRAGLRDNRPLGQTTLTLRREDITRRLFWLDVGQVFANGNFVRRVPLDGVLIPIQRQERLIDSSVPDTLSPERRREFVEAYCSQRALGAGACLSPGDPACRAQALTDDFVRQAGAEHGAAGSVIAQLFVGRMKNLTFDACVAALLP